MFKLFLTLFLYNSLKKISLINKLSLDDYVPDNIDKTIIKSINNNRWANMIALNTNRTIINPNRGGYDERFNDTEIDKDLEKIINHFNKQKLLKTFEDDNLSLDDKINIIKKDETLSPIKIKKGGLFNDWNFNFDDYEFKFNMLF